MAFKEIYQRYFSKLIRCLPMDDGLFLAMLSEHELLPGDTEGKVKSLPTQIEKATYFISHVIKPSLDVDSRVYLNKLLLVMSESGYKHVEEISSRIKSEIDSNTESSKTRKVMVIEKSSNNKVNDYDDYTERFTHDSDAVGAFAYLFDKLAIFFDEVEFKKLKRICTLRGADCPQDFRKQMQAAETLDDILDTLEKPNYCNWLNIRLLKRIVRLTEIPEAQSLLNAYEKCLYTKKVSEVRPYFKSKYFDPKHFSKVEAKINRHAEMLVVWDVIKFCQMLESDLKLPEGSVIATDCDSGCFKITCVIPVQCASHAYKMARENVYKFRKFHIQYIEIESYQKLFAMSYCISKEPSDLPLSSSKGIRHIISDHYTYLEAHMDADSVSHMMHCEHLITDDDYDAITAAPNDSKMNCLLLHYVKSMDIKELFKFCDILKSIETMRGISESLEASLKSSELHTFIKEKPLKMDKWSSSLEPSHVHLRFFDLVDEIILLLSGADKIPFNFANKCRSLMASNSHNIPLFTEPFVNKLINCKSVFLLKILLLPFLSWYDHCLLKELMSESDRVTDLLTQFDSLIDPNKPITAYPIPALSQMMIPLDDGFTIVATKSFYNLKSSSLKETLNIKATLVGQWDITDHALQLIGICAKLNYVYWMVSKCVVSIIMESSHNHEIQYKLWQKGIIMIAILPDLFADDLSISEQFTGGPFNILSSHQDMESSLYNKLVSVDAREVAKQNVLMQENLFIKYQRLMSEYKYAMSKLDNAETTLKLKVPMLENDYKTLVKKYQEIKGKNSELENELLINSQSQTRLTSEHKYAMSKLDNAETTLKLKIPKLDNERKTLVKKFQVFKGKNSELEKELLINSQSQTVSKGAADTVISETAKLSPTKDEDEFLSLHNAISRLEVTPLPHSPPRPEQDTPENDGAASNHDEDDIKYGYSMMKLVFVGDTDTGKRSLIERFVNNKFSLSFEPTTIVEFKDVEFTYYNTKCQLHLWNMPGHEDFRALSDVYYQDAMGVFVVYDVTRRESLESCLQWKKEIDDAVNGDPIPVVLIANKIDCGQLDGEQFSKENGFAGYFETSAKTGAGIKDAIHFMVKKVQHENQIRSTKLKSEFNILGDPAIGLVTEWSIFHEDYGIDVHISRIDELQIGESHLVAVNYFSDRNVQLEILCGLHGPLLTRLKGYLVSPIVMVSGGNRPLKMKVTIPHALAVYKNQIFNEVRVYTITTAGQTPTPLPSSLYKVDLSNCIVSTVINKQQVFAVTVMGNLKSTHTRILPSITPTPRPPAIVCVYAVFSKLFTTSTGPHINVTVYCAIDLPVIRKLLSDICEGESVGLETFILSHDYINISCDCKNKKRWHVSNFPYKISALHILLSSQFEDQRYPPSWEFGVTPRDNSKSISEQVTCRILFTASRTKLAQKTFLHNCNFSPGIILSNPPVDNQWANETTV